MKCCNILFKFFWKKHKNIKKKSIPPKVSENNIPLLTIKFETQQISKRRKTVLFDIIQS